MVSTWCFALACAASRASRRAARIRPDRTVHRELRGRPKDRSGKRCALSLLGDRLRVELAADLWTVLTADVVREIQAAMAEDSIDQAQMGAEFESSPDEEKREMNAFWYSVAAGEITVADRTAPAGEHS